MFLIQSGSSITAVIVNDESQLGVTPATYAIATGTMLIAGAGGFTSGAGQCAISPTAGEVTGAGQAVFVALDGGGAIVGRLPYQVVPWNPNDLAGLGLTRLDAAISTRTIVGDQMSLTPGTIATLQAALLSLATAFDGSNTVGEFLIAAAAILAGQEDTLLGTTTFKNWAGTKDRVTLQAITGGNRSPAAFDFS